MRKPAILALLLCCAVWGADPPLQTAKPLTEKQRAEAAIALAAFERSLRAYETAQRAAQQQQQQYNAILEEARRSSAAPQDCRLNDQFRWVRDTRNPQGQIISTVSCEAEALERKK